MHRIGPYPGYKVSEVVANLDELGIADNTIIVFADDTGTVGGGTQHGVKTPSGKG